MYRITERGSTDAERPIVILRADNSECFDFEATDRPLAEEILFNLNNGIAWQEPEDVAA